MRLFWLVRMSLLAVIARTQELQSCGVDIGPSTIGSTEDAGTLATSILGCPGDDVAVQWVGEVFVQETIRVTGGTSLNITGAGPGAIADGGSSTQLFHVDEGSTLHLFDMTLANGNTSTGDGGAIFVNRSIVSFSGSMSFISNHAGVYGGAIYAYSSTVSWDHDSTQFISNSAGIDGGAIFVYDSTLSWDGDHTLFGSNSAYYYGGAIFANSSTLSWGGDSMKLISNSAGYAGGAIFAGNSTVSWNGVSMQFISNSAGFDGGAIYAVLDSNVSWDVDSTQFSSNAAASGHGGAIEIEDSTLSWDGDSTLFSSNSAHFAGGAIHTDDSTVSWDGNSTQFRGNTAGYGGGAVNAIGSSVSWDGDNIQFISNSADDGGGAIEISSGSTLSWGSDSTQFSNNTALADGGAIKSSFGSNVSWDVDGTLFSNNHASDQGGAIYAQYDSSVSWNGDGTLFNTNAARGYGGAICASTESTLSWHGLDTLFSNNTAGLDGGAIRATSNSIVSWDGDGTRFGNNTAGEYGGVIHTDDSILSWGGNSTLFSNNHADSGGVVYAADSSVSWDGDGTFFSNNHADSGGVVYVAGSNVSWDGDGTLFSDNHARVEGGAIAAYGSAVSWGGDGTVFRNNAANEKGGAVAVYEYSTVSWDCDGTLFSNNTADDGGAICASLSSVFWDGGGTRFTSNNAAKDGGAIFAVDFQRFSWNGNPTFSGNEAGANGGALAFVDIRHEHDPEPFTAATLIDNRAEYAGGALYFLDCDIPLNFTDVTFQSNFAGGAGGAVTAQFAGDESSPVAFSRCTFLQNVAGNSGGAVEILAGHQDFDSCRFEGNSADIGGAMILGGNSTVVSECSFISNSASSRGLAVAVTGSADISGATFDGNELYCASGLLYREDTEEGGPNQRFEAVCFDCPDWDECAGCTIRRGDVKPVCEVPLEHTTAEGPGTTVETLTIASGYWRATKQSESILACYNADACLGGETGADGYCSAGYWGPYCSVCEAGYSSSLGYTCTRCSSSRYQGLMIATVIGAVIAVLAIALFCRYALSTELEDGNVGRLHRRVLRAVPMQALKILVVVWQILTQFAEVANLSYPGVYQDFLSAISIINFDLGSVLAAGCLWSEIDFHGRLLASTLWPLAAVGFLSVTYWVAIRGVRTTVGHASLVETIRRKHQTALLLLTFLVYSSVSSIVFQTFACETLDDGIEYLRADYRIQCTDAKHKTFEVYAGFMVIVYPVGIPLLYAILLFQHRCVLVDADADKAAAQAIVGLWEPYKPERFYYEVVECGRRIMLTGVVVFIFPNDAAQIAITLLIAFFFFGVLEELSPYESESDMWLSRGGHVLVFFSMFYMLLLKVDVSGERDQSQAAFAGVFVAGHVLMMLAIVVEVVGVCYASRKDVGGENAVASDSFPGLRPRARSDDVSVFESVPSLSWKSFLRRESVSVEPGPTRSVASTEARV